MKTRIYRPCPSGLYWGQVYNEKYKCWEDVTLSCITKHGAKRALKKWLNEQEEFET